MCCLNETFATLPHAPDGFLRSFPHSTYRKSLSNVAEACRRSHGRARRRNHSEHTHGRYRYGWRIVCIEYDPNFGDSNNDDEPKLRLNQENKHGSLLRKGICFEIHLGVGGRLSFGLFCTHDRSSPRTFQADCIAAQSPLRFILRGQSPSRFP
jgi:hypothetical protein